MDQQYSESGLTHMLEAANGSVEELMHSKFGFIREQVKLQIAKIERFQPGLDPVDYFFRDSISTVLYSQLNRPGTFILLDLATQHAVACQDIFNKNGYDVNYLYYPIITKNTNDLHHGYDPLATGRVLEVLSDAIHCSNVLKAKGALQRNSLNGVVLNIHSHSNTEEEEQLAKQFPRLDELHRLGISRVLYLDETSPENGIIGERVLYGDVTDKEKSLVHMFENPTKIQAYLMDLIRDGFSITERGIDTRPIDFGERMLTSGPLRVGRFRPKL